MATRIGINGFGRIGRQVFKALCDYYGDEIEVVGINDLTDNETLAHLLPVRLQLPASSMATWRSPTTRIIVDGVEIKAFAERDPSKLPWGDLGAEIVIESTGFFTDADKARLHRQRRRQEGHHLRPGQGRGHHASAWASTTSRTTRRCTTSSPTPPARPTAWPRSPRCCNDRSASCAA